MKSKAHLLILGIFFALSGLPDVHGVMLNINPLECPESLTVGERGSVLFTIANFGNHVTLNDVIVSVSGPNDKNGSQFVEQTNIVFPHNLSYREQVSIQGWVSSQVPGFHYIDVTTESEAPGEQTNTLSTEICSFKTLSPQKDESLDQTLVGIVLSALLFPTIGGFVGYLLKKHWVKKDVEYQTAVTSMHNQKEIQLQEDLKGISTEKAIDLQHNNWLLQHMHHLSITYYGRIVKFAARSHVAIEIASISRDYSAIKSAYFFLWIFLSVYVDFERAYGASYLFKYRDMTTNIRQQNSVMGFAQAIFVGLPFDRRTIFEIAHLKSTNIEHDNTISNAFKLFSDWIKSDNCKTSISLVIKNLRDLQNALNKETERITNPYYFSDKKEGDSLSGGPVTIPTELQTIPYMLWADRKIVLKGEEIVVNGKFFKKPKGTYKFEVRDQSIDDFTVIDDRYIRIKIPSVPAGTYDLLLSRRESESFKRNEEAIVLHIL